jgi:hypothetical protein
MAKTTAQAMAAVWRGAPYLSDGVSQAGVGQPVRLLSEILLLCHTCFFNCGVSHAE